MVRRHKKIHGHRTIPPGQVIDVAINGDEVVLTGPDIRHVGQTAANIEQVTMIKGYDPRVFQDGIYITQKGKEA